MIRHPAFGIADGVWRRPDRRSRLECQYRYAIPSYPDVATTHRSMLPRHCRADNNVSAMTVVDIRPFSDPQAQRLIRSSERCEEFVRAKPEAVTVQIMPYGGDGRYNVARIFRFVQQKDLRRAWEPAKGVCGEALHIFMPPSSLIEDSAARRLIVATVC